MEGDSQVRRCGDCNRSVYNLSEMGRSEAQAILDRSKSERTCVMVWRSFQKIPLLAGGAILLAATGCSPAKSPVEASTGLQHPPGGYVLGEMPSPPPEEQQVTRPAQPGLGPSLAEWEGNYKDSYVSELDILPDGKFKKTASCNSVGLTDVLTPVILTGTASIDADGWIHLVATHKSIECPVAGTYHYYGVRRGASRLLVAHESMLFMVNELNAGRSSRFADTTFLRNPAPPHNEPPEGALQFDPLTFLPKQYLAKLLHAPLTGTVVNEVKLGGKMINVAGWMHKPEMREQRSARVTIDRGYRQGVFVGMRLHSAGRELVVEQVLEDEAYATHAWIPPAEPRFVPGTAVSSRL